MRKSLCDRSLRPHLIHHIHRRSPSPLYPNQHTPSALHSHDSRSESDVYAYAWIVKRVGEETCVEFEAAKRWERDVVFEGWFG